MIVPSTGVVKKWQALLCLRFDVCGLRFHSQVIITMCIRGILFILIQPIETPIKLLLRRNPFMVLMAIQQVKEAVNS